MHGIPEVGSAGGEERGEFARGGAILHHAGGDADDGGHGVDVVGHDRAGADDGFETDADVLHDGRADADERAGFHDDVTGEANARADVGGGSNHGLVIDDAACVKDGIVADLAMGADERAGGDDDAFAQRGIGGKLGRRVDGIFQFEAALFDEFAHGAADAVVADGDDRAADVPVMKVGENGDVAEDGEAVDSAAVERLIVVEKADRFEPLGLEKDIEDDPPVSARAENDDVDHLKFLRVGGSTRHEDRSVIGLRDYRPVRQAG